MKNFAVSVALGTVLGGCMISPEGVRVAPPPPAVQGSNDAQGAPISVPGSGMGVGAGNPSAPGASGLGPAPPR